MMTISLYTFYIFCAIAALAIVVIIVFLYLMLDGINDIDGKIEAILRTRHEFGSDDPALVVEKLGNSLTLPPAVENAGQTNPGVG